MRCSRPGFTAAHGQSPPPRPGPRAWDGRHLGPGHGARTRALNPGPPNPQVPAGQAPDPPPKAGLWSRAARGGFVPAPERAAWTPRGPLSAAPPPPGFPSTPLPGRSARSSARAQPLPSPGPPRRGPAPTHCAAAAVAAGPGDAGGRRARARGRASPRPVAAAAAAAEGTTEPAPGVAAPAARSGRRLSSGDTAPQARAPPNGVAG